MNGENPIFDVVCIHFSDAIETENYKHYTYHKTYDIGKVF